LAERIVDYEDVPYDKNVKLVVLKLSKYTSLWWENIFKKGAGKEKSKISRLEKMKAKLKDHFPPPSYL